MPRKTFHAVAFAALLACGHAALGQSANPLSPSDAPSDNPLDGRPADGALVFTDGRMTVTVRPDQNRAGAYAGSIARNGRTYDLAVASGADGLTGTFSDAAGHSYPVTATVADGTLTLVTGGSTYTLRSASPGFAPTAATDLTPAAPAADAPIVGIGISLSMNTDASPVTYTVTDQQRSNTPSGRAGLRPGDRITVVDGHQIATSDDTQWFSGPKGGQTTITFVRDGQEHTVTFRR